MARAPRERDYRAEYQRRIELGRERGISRAAARGHRGPADAERAIRSADAVTSAITGRDAKGRVTEVTLLVTGRDGLTRAFTVRKGPRFDATMRRISRVIGTSDATYLVYNRKGRQTVLDTYMEGK